MHLVALGDLPYTYYVLLRWVTTGGAFFLAVKAMEWEHSGWTWIFGFIALLFNPFIPIYLEKEIWQIVNLSVAILSVIAIFQLKPPSIY